MIHPPLARRPLGALAAPRGRALLTLLLPLALGCPSMLPELRNETGDKVMSPLQPQPPMVNAAPEEPDERDAAQPDASRAGGDPDPQAALPFRLRPHVYREGERVRLVATHTWEQTVAHLDSAGEVERSQSARRRTRLSALVTVLATTPDGRPLREEYQIRRCELNYGGQVRALLPVGAEVLFDRAARPAQRLRLRGAALPALTARVLSEIITAGRDDLQGGALLTPPATPLEPGDRWPLPASRLSQRLLESGHLRARGLSGQALLVGARTAGGVPFVHVAARLALSGAEVQELPEGLLKDDLADPSETRVEVLLGALLPRGDYPGGEGALEIRAQTPAIRYVGDDRRRVRISRHVTVQQRVKPSPPSDVAPAARAPAAPAE